MKDQDNNQKFKYVQIKIKKVVSRKQTLMKKSQTEGEKIMFQLLDVSDKILYNEVKAE